MPRPQFTLRALLILTTVVAILVGWSAELVRRKREAVAAIEAMGGEAFWAEGDVTEVWFSHSLVVQPDGIVVVTDEPLTLTDDGMKYIESLPTIRDLRLCDVPITDAGLMRLHALKNLKWLHLEHTRVTEYGIAELQKVLPKCDIECYP